MSFGRFTPAVRFNPNRVTGGSARDTLHRKLNYELCTAINITSLSCVLQDLVNIGALTEAQASIYHDQAGGLLALICTENNRFHDV